MSRRYKQLEDNRLEHRVIMEDALGFKLPIPIWDLQKSLRQKRRKTLKSRLRRILPMNFCQYII